MGRDALDENETAVREPSGHTCVVCNRMVYRPPNWQPCYEPPIIYSGGRTVYIHNTCLENSRFDWRNLPENTISEGIPLE